MTLAASMAAILRSVIDMNHYTIASMYTFHQGGERMSLLVCGMCSLPVIRTPKLGWHHANPVTECTWGRPERPGVHLRDEP